MPYSVSANAMETRCSVAVFRDESVLLVRSEENGSPVWKLPGGHVRADEGLIACARRELYEETGLLAGRLHCAFILDVHDRQSGRYIVEIVLFPTGGVDGEAECREEEREPRFVPMAELHALPLRPRIHTQLHDLRDLQRRDLADGEPSQGASLYPLHRARPAAGT
ncbi:NUDIX hydrolase [Streptomyces sp900116325]|uniref:NUDIX hydrolase n=1 Tax=Streptomyces sp. 900116325 TaxID=3154295 RepID=UPI0033B0DDA5